MPAPGDNQRSPGAKRRAETGTSSLLFWDRVAGSVISMGGLIVLAAVLGISVYLISVAAPLFGSGRAVKAEDAGPAVPSAQRVWVTIDEYGDLLLAVGDDGVFRAWARATGESSPFLELPLSDAGEVSAVGWHPGEPLIALGFEDGSVVVAEFAVTSTVVGRADLPPDVDLEIGSSERLGSGPDAVVWTLVSEDEARRTSVTAAVVGEIFGAAEAPALAVDVAPELGGGFQVLAWRDTAELSTVQPSRREGDPPRIESFELEGVPRTDPPVGAFLLEGRGGSVIIWNDGRALRHTTPRRRSPPVLADELEMGSGVVGASLIAGGKTIVTLSEDGGVRSWFSARADSGHADGRELVMGRDITVATAATGIDGVPLARMVVLYGPSETELWHTTSGKRIARLSGESPGEGVAFSPRARLATVFELDGAKTWELDSGFGDVSASALAGKVRYEEQDESSYVYQSTSASDTAEAKLSLVPLVFGTMKATIFAMLFAAPVAVLAAIYSSEFMNPKLKRVVKPAVEMMASLPSVVLGFFAAMVLAPAVRDALPSVLVAFVVFPVLILMGAYIRQCVPDRFWPNRGAGKFGVIGLIALAGAAVIPAGGGILEGVLFKPQQSELVILAGVTQPVPDAELPAWFADGASMDERRLEQLARRDGMAVSGETLVRPDPAADESARAAAIEATGLAGGDLRSWLNGVYGGPFAGWVVIMVGPGAFVAWLLIGRAVPEFVLRTRGVQIWGAPGRALLGFVLSLGVTALLTLVFSSVLSAAGLDPRDSIFGAFSVRNTLVVGLIMGFAVIPVIYTISEDALSSVPNSLRSASLGAGATPWQTAVRVVLPVAASGIFGAVMIGLGRAVGETMIVLMATGNTPVMDWNIFEGFRTLAANIATELPEAEVGSTHYRVLFLCGLTLFGMTFLINTTAELVRQHFRRRNALL